MNKICSKCKQDQDISNFNKQTKSKDGLGSYCKSCIKIYKKENPSVFSNALSKYRNNNKDSLRARARSRYNLIRDKEINRTKRYNKLHKEERASYGKKYSQTKQGSFIVYKGNAKQRNREWALELTQFDSIVSKPCFYCGDVDSKGFNGIDRVDNGIGYTFDNSVSCCKMCNYMKKNYSLDEFLNKVKKIYNFKLSS